MNQVFGRMNLYFSIPVQSENETMALLEANFKLNPDWLVGYKFEAINCHGERIKVDVHECEIEKLEEFVEM